MSRFAIVFSKPKIDEINYIQVRTYSPFTSRKSLLRFLRRYFAAALFVCTMQLCMWNCYAIGKYGARRAFFCVENTWGLCESRWLCPTNRYSFNNCDDAIIEKIFQKSVVPISFFLSIVAILPLHLLPKNLYNRNSYG